jgi:hypothetical protein
VSTAPTEELRDRLTRLHLTSGGEAPEATEIRRFRRGWWDGAVRIPALAFAQARPMQRDVVPRIPVVRRGDLPIAKPTTPRRRADLPQLVVRIDQEADVLRCTGANCSALVPIPPPGRLLGDTSCPRCGRVELPAQQVSPDSGMRLSLR